MTKTNLGLIKYAKAQVGKPYWWGTYGQISTKSLYENKKKQYPGSYEASDFLNQLGVKVHDCSGLIKGYLMSDSASASAKYVAKYDKSADGMLSAAEEKGAISTLPEIPGLLVHKKGHVGIYIGNGEVIEARSHAKGVIKSKLKELAWTNWSRCPWLEYSIQETSSTTATLDTSPDNVKEVQAYLNAKINAGLEVDGKYGSLTKKALIKYWQKIVGGLTVDGIFGTKSKAKASKNNLEKGDKSELIRIMQMALICKGYSLAQYGADGSFGSTTDTVLRKFQKAMGLTVDGICGKNTWTALFS